MFIPQLHRKINPAIFIYVNGQSTTLVSLWIEKNVFNFNRPHMHKLQKDIQWRSLPVFPAPHSPFQKPLTFHIPSKAVCALTMCFINGNSGKLFTLFYNLLFSLFYLEDLYKYIELPFSFLQLHNVPHNHLYWHFILDTFFCLFFPINSLYSIWESTVVVWNILDI